MSDDTIRLVSVGWILRRRWRLLALLALMGALVGYSASMLFPPRYTASASVLLPGQWEERELLTQSEIAASAAVVDRAADALAWPAGSRGDLRDHVSAQAADGNIIKISATADAPERAQRISDEVAQQFVTFAARIAGDNTATEAASGSAALRQQVAETNQRISDLAKAADPGQTVESVQARTELEKLRTGLQEAMKKLDQADPAANKAGMFVMGPAARPSSQAPPTKTQLTIAGAALFVLLAVIGHLGAARMSRRPRTAQEITAALGSVLLGTVEVSRDRHAHPRTPRGPRAWIRGFLGIDTRWDLPVARTGPDESGRRIRFQRVCARLQEQLPSPRFLLVLVPDGDELALRAAEQLVIEAKGDPLLRVVGVSVYRPMVPDHAAESGALVVLSAGNRTAEELAGITEACADSRHDVVGVVIACPVRVRPTRSAEQPPDRGAMTLAGHGQAAGGAP
ncbi:Wzz/FepE/Etk N-terminal domain-containing protein [Streptomyces sp. NPDC059819]|uniref:Wzz/FepE/Etk N-terminal domain-containing protein n=1 Tax=Streptomyces sp. NPDC059819 TaxID=3346963 RepID=UPI00364A1D3F